MKKFFSILVHFFAFLSPSFAQLKLPKYISDGMVLQRGEVLKIWGWASPKEKIDLTMGKLKLKALSSENGLWEIMLPAQAAGGPFEIKLTGKNEVILKDIVFGDVWFCSGQSNMVLNMERVKERFKDDIAKANYPLIRNLFIPTLTSLSGPKDDIQNIGWKPATGANVLQIGAATFFFARDLFEKYGVPIGIVNSSVGGTPIEAWISEEGFKDFSEILPTIQKNKDTSYVNSTNRIAFASNQRPPQAPTDKGLTESTKWFDADYKPKGWRAINIPGYWEDQGIKDLNGVVWYRKEINIPANLVNMPAKVFMGRIVDADFMYVNGTQIGNITYQYPPRRYTVPNGVLKEGKNVFVIRVINNGGKGGFVPDKPYFVEIGDQKIDLKGEWQYKVGDVFVPRPPTPQGINNQNQPSALFNAMVAPFTKMAIKGILWYQGETNAGQPEAYALFLPALIRDWRSKFGKPDAPFLYAQLPNFMDVNYLPGESQWAVMRESQMKALALPNTGMAITIDAGEWNDIHPLDKKTVGTRLARLAKKLAYNETALVHSGPIFESSQIEGQSILVSFSSVGSGLVSNDGEELSWFSIAQEDKKFVWAKAEIVNNKVRVWNDAIPNPKYVRYAWADNPAGCNLYNKEGLPASPFKTDGSK